MPILLERRTVLATMAALAATRPGLAQNGETENGETLHEVAMLTRDPENPRRRNVFEPPLLVVEPGDTVRFVPVDPSHNSQSIEEMVPEGGESWRGAINEEIEVTLSTPGIYGYQCLPHYALGMVGLIFVRGEGMLDNLEQARSVRHRGQAAERFEELWAAAEEEGLLSQES